MTFGTKLQSLEPFTIDHGLPWAVSRVLQMDFESNRTPRLDRPLSPVSLRCPCLVFALRPFSLLCTCFHTSALAPCYFRRYVPTYTKITRAPVAKRLCEAFKGTVPAGTSANPVVAPRLSHKSLPPKVNVSGQADKMFANQATKQVRLALIAPPSTAGRLAICSTL